MRATKSERKIKSPAASHLCTRHDYVVIIFTTSKNHSISLITIMLAAFSVRFVAFPFWSSTAMLLCVWSAFVMQSTWFSVSTAFRSFASQLMRSRSSTLKCTLVRWDKNGNEWGRDVWHVMQFICIIINSYISRLHQIFFFRWALLSCLLRSDIVTTVVIFEHYNVLHIYCIIVSLQQKTAAAALGSNSFHFGYISRMSRETAEVALIRRQRGKEAKWRAQQQ